MIKPGIYADIDIDDYHASEGISSSGISLILDCPKRYWHEYINKTKPTEKEATEQRNKFMMGRALHMLVLEPEKFDATFFVMHEEVNLTTKVGKEAYAKAQEAANGRQIIRAKDWADIQGMAEASKAHPMWKTFFFKEEYAKPSIEHSVFWEGGLYKTRLRSRPDIFNDRLIVDLKTTDSISNFKRSLFSYGYHRQAAMQIDGLGQFDDKVRYFGFFVVEKKAPYLTACFTVDDELIQIGRREYLDAAATYHECLTTDLWPGYEINDENGNILFTKIDAPKWATNNEENSF